MIQAFRDTEEAGSRGLTPGIKTTKSLVEFGTLWWGGRLCDDSCTFHGPWPDLWMSPSTAGPPPTFQYQLAFLPLPFALLSTTLFVLFLVLCCPSRPLLFSSVLPSLSPGRAAVATTRVQVGSDSETGSSWVQTRREKVSSVRQRQQRVIFILDTNTAAVSSPVPPLLLCFILFFLIFVSPPLSCRLPFDSDQNVVFSLLLENLVDSLQLSQRCKQYREG